MMKIELIFFLPNFQLGGAGSSITKICVELANKFNITVISLTKNYYSNKLKKKGINVVKLNSNKTIFSFKEINNIIEEKINQKKKVIFVSNINYANALSCILIKRKNNLKLFLVERTPLKELFVYQNTIDFIKKKIIYYLIKLFYKKADKIIGNSTKISTSLKKICKKNTETIFPPSIIKVKKKLFFIRKETTILTAARLSFEKDIITILKAVKIIKNNFIKLVVVGDGVEKMKLKEYIKNNKLTKKVKFLGQKKNIIKYLKSSDLFVNSSFFEGFPNSVVEALNYNVPVIATHSDGGIYDIIKYGRKNSLYAPKNHYILAKKIEFFHNNKLKFNKKILKNKKNFNQFTLKNSSRKYEILFNSIFK